MRRFSYSFCHFYEDYQSPATEFATENRKIASILAAALSCSRSIVCELPASIADQHKWCPEKWMRGFGGIHQRELSLTQRTCFSVGRIFCVIFKGQGRKAHGRGRLDGPVGGHDAARTGIKECAGQTGECLSRQSLRARRVARREQYPIRLQAQGDDFTCCQQRFIAPGCVARRA